MEPINDDVVQLWNDPTSMLGEWDNSADKLKHELLVAQRVGVQEHVVDLGCGAGRLVPALEVDVELGSVSLYHGFDASTAMIREAKRKYDKYAIFSVVDIFNFSTDTEYDVAIMLDVAQHQVDPVSSILRMLQIWQAGKYVFSLLVGDEREELSMSRVVAFTDLLQLLDVLADCEIYMERLGEERFAWVLVECSGLG